MTKLRTVLARILIGIALVGILGIAIRYFRDIRHAREKVESLQSQVVETDCGPIEYADRGEGYPVLTLHAALGGFDQGLRLANQYIDSGFRVISISRFGYLRSPLPANASLTLQADAYTCLLDALGIDKAAFFGISAGVPSAMIFAARHPERVSALIVLSPGAPAPGQVVEESLPPKAIFEIILSDFGSWAQFTYFRAGMQSTVGVPDGFPLTPELAAEVKDTLEGTLPSSPRTDGMIFDTYTAGSEFYSDISPTGPYPLSKIETPVLMLTAMDDPFATPEDARYFVNHLPNARLVILSDGGHLLLGHTAEVKAAILEFLRSIVLNDS